jgi:excisionase family DNA binding protein
MPRQRYLTSTEAAERLHVSPKTISRWSAEGRLPHVRTFGGHRRYDPQQIDRIAREMNHPTHDDQRR